MNDIEKSFAKITYTGLTWLIRHQIRRRCSSPVKLQSPDSFVDVWYFVTEPHVSSWHRGFKEPTGQSWPSVTSHFLILPELNQSNAELQFYGWWPILSGQWLIKYASCISIIYNFIHLNCQIIGAPIDFNTKKKKGRRRFHKFKKQNVFFLSLTHHPYRCNNQSFWWLMIKQNRLTELTDFMKSFTMHD